jgi:methylated-DNA-[protein]-cysteine S-methyltransferase
MDISRQSAKEPTVFEARVYVVVRGIPAGRVSSYGAVGVACGCGSARAVGSALRKNPFAPEVACHRVVRANGELGGFFGESGVAAREAKRRLLEAEGVGFDQAGRVEERFILRRL